MADEPTTAETDTSPEEQKGTQESPNEPEKDSEDPNSVEALKKALAKANKDAERNRRRSEEAQSDAAEAAQAALAAKIAEALGLKEPEKADPAQLTAELAGQQAATRAAQLELAVWRSASTAEGNPAALLDSRAFMASLEQVSPTDTGAVTEAIRAAVAANEALRATPSRRVPGPNPAIGATGTAPTREQVLAAAERDGNKQLVAQMKTEQLMELRSAQKS